MSSAYTHVSSLINSVNLSAYTEATPNLAQTLFSPAISQCAAAARDRSLPKVTWSREKQFVEFCESAWELGPGRGNTLPMPSIASSAAANDDDDNDDIEVFSRMSLTCPVTLLPLKEPVRNPRCGHLYSRQGISSLITSTSYAIQCPVGGCSGTVTLQALVPDRRAETLLKRLEENIFFLAESGVSLLAGGGNTQQMTQFTSQK